MSIIDLRSIAVLFTKPIYGLRRMTEHESVTQLLYALIAAIEAYRTVETRQITLQNFSVVEARKETIHRKSWKANRGCRKVTKKCQKKYQG